MEIQDAYVRLDNTLGDLLDLIDRKVGLNNTLILLLLPVIRILIPLILRNTAFPAESFTSSAVLPC